MSPSINHSFKVCLVLSYGLMGGLAVEFARHVSFGSSNWLVNAAYFVAYVLFNALLGGIVGGAVFSAVVFPVHYFVIRRYDRFVLAFFLVLGLILGTFGFKALLSALR